MSKISVLASAVVLTFAASSLAMAASNGPTGFDNGSASRAPQGFSQAATANNTVRDVLNQGRDDQKVTLTGKLTNYLGHDRYEFTDATGSIEVELDDDRDWSSIKKDQLITIFGEVDRDHHNISIEVKDARAAE